jgi:maltose alpha-D-glucosyltransferase/alpha-amylase
LALQRVNLWYKDAVIYQLHVRSFFDSNADGVGDEIGMGDNIYLGDRNGVRTPMQWSPRINAGFSQADPERLYAPVISNAVYGYRGVNVEAQEHSEHSLLNWMKSLIPVRNAFRAFSRGSLQFLDPANPRVHTSVR